MSCPDQGSTLVEANCRDLVGLEPPSCWSCKGRKGGTVFDAGKAASDGPAIASNWTATGFSSTCSQMEYGKIRVNDALASFGESDDDDGYEHDGNNNPDIGDDHHGINSMVVVESQRLKPNSFRAAQISFKWIV